MTLKISLKFDKSFNPMSRVIFFVNFAAERQIKECSELLIE
jgi:hypothetical protein